MAEPGPNTIPIAFPPGLNRTSTPSGIGAKWWDGHLARWVAGRLRPVNGWERMALDQLSGGPIRAMHVWIASVGEVRLGILCETKLWVLEGADVAGGPERLRDVTPPGGIAPPSEIRRGGYGNDKYGAGKTPPGDFPNIYGMGRRNMRTDYRSVGEVWRLANWGDDLLAMASPDGRLLKWTPGPDIGGGFNTAVAVANAPLNNRTFVVTSERHVMLFAMGGAVNKFGWCSQENITDWDFASVTNTAGFYSIEPASRIIDAVTTQYSTIFWTVQGAYAVSYKALPFVYTYNYLGEQSAPLSAQAAVAHSGSVTWAAADGFYRFDGSAIQVIPCPILDWFQQSYDEIATRAHMSGWYNGAFAEIWWGFPRKADAGAPLAVENDTLIIYNPQEGWWSIGHDVKRTCGVSGTLISYPLMAGGGYIYRLEKGLDYPDTLERPWIRSGFFGLDKGVTMATTRQILVDTDADLEVVSYQLFATKGRYNNAPERTGGPKVPVLRHSYDEYEGNVHGQGKIDYRISGRDFSVRMQMMAAKPWSFGEGLITIMPRGRRGGP